MTVVLNQRTGARRASTAALLMRLEAHTEFGKVRRNPLQSVSWEGGGGVLLAKVQGGPLVRQERPQRQVRCRQWE